MPSRLSETLPTLQTFVGSPLMISGSSLSTKRHGVTESSVTRHGYQ
ncbi:Protein of unknown function [Pyronema omphalodes CBS 100304]|uniref:Uncharacterized protein n=1 Tax=Pyronema omphalodes (strain CBS 100304) TaxID=1076935 RepID=U4LLM3_PYROM|nr:Protein of unknown function [Pyronema omphalodes CBS 100304]